MGVQHYCLLLAVLAPCGVTVRINKKCKNHKDKDILNWLSTGADVTKKPVCLRRDLAAVLRDYHAEVAPVLSQWCDDESSYFSGLPHVDHVDLVGSNLIAINNDVTPDSNPAWKKYKLADHLVPPGGTIIEVGAHVGVVSVLLAKLNPNAHLVVFEPGRQNRFLLELNLAINGVRYISDDLYGWRPLHALDSHGRRHNHAIGSDGIGDVQVRSEAIGSRKEKREFSFAPLGADTSSLANTSRDGPDKIIFRTYDNLMEDISDKLDDDIPRITYEVNTTTLDDVLDELGARTVDFLKIDCEGCEYEVIDTLRDDTVSKFKYVTGERHSYKKTKQNQFMCEHGWNMDGLVCK